MTLIHDDCLNAMQSIPDQSVDLCLTDPPYGATANTWDQVIDFGKMWEQLKRVLRPGAAIALFGVEPFSSMLRLSNLKNFKYDWVWNKVLKSGHLNAKKMPMRQHELISIFGFGKIHYYPVFHEGNPLHSQGSKRSIKSLQSSNYGGQAGGHPDRGGDTKRYPTTVLTFPKPHASICSHPTQKPVELLEYLIRTYTLPGEVVLDFTIGSGSTGVASMNTGREFIGIEKDPLYFGFAETRIRAVEARI